MATTRPIKALNFFQQRLGLTPMQAAGLVGNLQQESTQELNPSILGDNGASFGIAQWQGPRRRALTDFAQQRGTDPGDFDTQLEFLANEMETTERASFEALQRTENVGDAASTAVGFFRPSQPHTERRQRLAMNLASGRTGGGGGVQITPAGGTPQAQRGLLADAATPNMEGGGLLADNPQGFLERAAGPGGFLSSSFLSNLGAGLLAGNRGGATFGQALGQGLLQANQATARAGQNETERLRNEAVRQQLTQAREKRQATSELRALFQDNPEITASDPRVRSLLFDIDPGAALETLTPRDPRGLEARFQATEDALGRPLTAEEISNMSGAAGEAGQLAVPLSPNDLNRMRLPNGEPLPLGTTLQQAIQLNARVVSEGEQKRLAEADASLAVIGELERLAVGPEGIFTDVDQGLLEQGAAALTFAFQDLTRGDPRVSRFNDLRGAVVGPLIRSFGESGALSDGDVRRAMGLLPSTGSLNVFNPRFADSEEQAREKFNTLRRLIEKGVRNLREGRTAEDGARGGGDRSGGAASGEADFRFDPNSGQLVPGR